MATHAEQCYHCGLANPAKPYTVRIAGHVQQVCCQGCAAVAQIIAGNGLDAVYQQRTAYQPSLNQAQKPQTFAWHKEQGAETKYTQLVNGVQRECHLLIEGLSCGACVWLCEQSLQGLKGVESLNISFESHRLHVVYNELSSLAAIVEHISALGYTLKPYEHQAQTHYFVEKQRQLLLRIGVSGLSMMLIVAFSLSLYFGNKSQSGSAFPQAINDFMLLSNMVLSACAISFCAWPFFKGALSALRQRIISMDVTISLALLGAYGLSVWSVAGALLMGNGAANAHETYFESLIMLVFFILISRYTEIRVAHKNAQQLHALQTVQPLNVKRVNSLDDTQLSITPLSELKTGDVIQVLPTETIAVDGLIVKGSSELDESLLNGEFLPVQRGQDEQVFAGSINKTHVLMIKVSHVGEGTRLSAIQKLAGDIKSLKPRWLSLADKTAHWFLLAVIATAVLAALAWWFIDASRMFSVLLAVLIAACPCALSIATPTAITRAVLHLRQQGIVVRNTDALQTLAKVKHIAFDKTGTLTQVEPSIVDIQLGADYSKNHVLTIAAALQVASLHPVAAAFKHINTPQAARHITPVAGKGIQAHYEGLNYRIGSLAFIQQWHPHCTLPTKNAQDLWLVLANKQAVLAWFCLRETLRPQWPALANFAKGKNFVLSILSGDKQSRLEALQGSLGLNSPYVYGDLSANDKAAFISKHQQNGEPILMVGDGINDSPAMAAASCSVAMPIAPDLAKEQADVILLQADLSKINRLFNVSWQLNHIIKQGFVWSLAYNLVAIALAVSGLLSPVLAVVGMSLSSAVVVFNSQRVSSLNARPANVNTKAPYTAAVPA